MTSARTCAEVCRNPGACGGTFRGSFSQSGGTCRKSGGNWGLIRGAPCAKAGKLQKTGLPTTNRNGFRTSTVCGDWRTRGGRITPLTKCAGSTYRGVGRWKGQCTFSGKRSAPGAGLFSWHLVKITATTADTATTARALGLRVRSHLRTGADKTRIAPIFRTFTGNAWVSWP